jgi:ABC-2 type transport system permease protein
MIPEQNIPSNIGQNSRPFLRWQNIFQNNPIIRKEFRSRMRPLRTFLTISGFLLFISLGVVLILLALGITTNQGGALEIWQRAGKIIFATTFFIELFLISFIAPALTSGAIAGEREHQTYDLLRTTRLSASRLVLGKMIAAVSFLGLLVLVSLPLYSLAYMFGGVDTAEILIGSLILFLTIFSYSSIGIFFSSLFKRTLPATVFTYIFVLVFLVVIPVFMVAMLTIFGPIVFSSNLDPSVSNKIILYTFGWILVSLSPLSTAVTAEAAYLGMQGVWIVELPLTSEVMYKLLSPWIPYVLFHIALVITTLLFAIHRVDQPEK